MKTVTYRGRLLRSTLLTGCAALMAGVSVPAYSQTTDQEIEEIFITGSRIGRSNLSSPTAVTIFDETAIELSGATNVAQLIRELPQAGVTQLTSTRSNFFTQSSGLNAVELRNLGVDRTLVLVNGRRFVGGVPGSSVVDFNSIPTEFIERIEVITGGASAVYGSDALAGVINIILKSKMDGLVFTSQAGISEEGDDETYQASVTAGSSFGNGRGHALANVSWSKENGVYVRDRAISAVDDISGIFFGDPYNRQVTPFLSSFSEWGRFAGMNSSTLATETGFYIHDVDGTAVSFDGVTHGFNRNAFRAISVPNERIMFSSILNYDVFDNAGFYFEGTYASTRSSSSLEPFALHSEDVFGDNRGVPIATNAMIPINLMSAINDELATTNTAGLASAITSDTLFNTAGDGVNPYVPGDPEYIIPGSNFSAATIDELTFRRRMSEVDQRSSNNLRQTARFVLGMEGDFDNGYHWDVNYTYGRTTQDQRGTGQVNVMALAEGLRVEPDGAGGFQCMSEAARLLGCVPVDVFGLGAISPEAADWIRADGLRSAIIVQQVANATVTGDLFEMPAGPFGVAAGFEYRDESSENLASALIQRGLDAGNISPNTVGGFDVWEGYFEFDAPIIRDRAGIHALDLGGAVRFSDYSSGGTTTAWSVRLEYSPAQDWRFRTQAARAVRAPNISELFTPASETFEGAVDPCDGVVTADAGTSITADNCLSITAIATRAAMPGGFVLSQEEIEGVGGFNSGNPDLGAEESDSWTAGLVYSASQGMLTGLAASVDYYNIEVEGAIAGVARQFAVNQCYVETAGLASPFCNLIVRDINGAMDEVNSPQQNSGLLTAEGFDVAVSYPFDLNALGWNPLGGDAGELMFALQYNNVVTYELVQFGVTDDDLGQVDAPEHKATFAAVYTRGPLQFAWDVLYWGESDVDVDDAAAGFDVDIGYRTKHDIQFRYALMDGQATLMAGVDNLFDEYAPYLGGSYGNNPPGVATDGGIFDPIGRRFYVGFRLDY